MSSSGRPCACARDEMPQTSDFVWAENFMGRPGYVGKETTLPPMLSSPSWSSRVESLKLLLFESYL